MNQEKMIAFLLRKRIVKTREGAINFLSIVALVNVLIAALIIYVWFLRPEVELPQQMTNEEIDQLYHTTRGQ